MKVTGHWITVAASQAVLSMLTNAGYQAFFVGGCVRNDLLHAPVGDIDIATDAVPQTVIDLATSAGLKPVPTGVDHGTITVVSDGIPHEVTTFRADVETDGRRAVVRYSRDIIEDASRRDFTINALYATADGTIVDPLNGLPDLLIRRVRFIDNPKLRIREDYLRILRFFRFHAWYGDANAGMDPDALDAIAQEIDGLSLLSRERIGSEVMKLMSAPNPAPSVAAMQSCGALNKILPGAETRAMAPLVHLEQQQGIAPDPIRRLAAIGVQDGAALRLSKADQRRLGQLQQALASGDTAATIGYRLGLTTAIDVLLLISATLGQPINPSDLATAQTGAAAKFPVTATDLMPRYSGPALGEQLKTLEKRWIETGFSLGRDALLKDT